MTIHVTANTSSVATQVQSLVTYYNQFRKKLDDDTAYDSTTDTAAVLTGDTTALQLDTQMSNFLTGQFFGLGSIRSLADLGITFNKDGTLALDTTKLTAQLAASGDAVKRFFTTEKTGFAAKLNDLIDNLSGPSDPTKADNSLLTLGIKSLQETIDENKAKMDAMLARLDDDRNRLTQNFYNMELAIAKLQNSLNALSSIDWITDTSSSNSLFSKN